MSTVAVSGVTVCPPTALNLSLQHEIRLRYLFMHRAQNHSFYKLTDTGYGWEREI